jgi:hypothetical protein
MPQALNEEPTGANVFSDRELLLRVKSRTAMADLIREIPHTAAAELTCAKLLNEKELPKKAKSRTDTDAPSRPASNTANDAPSLEKVRSDK